jgi:hypothetical protein
VPTSRVLIGIVHIIGWLQGGLLWLDCYDHVYVLTYQHIISNTAGALGAPSSAMPTPWAPKGHRVPLVCNCIQIQMRPYVVRLPVHLISHHEKFISATATPLSEGKMH